MGFDAGCVGAVGGCGGMEMSAPVMSAPASMPSKTPEKVKAPSEDKSAIPAPATIVVSLPADAKLTVDDAPTVSTSANRVFVSPELQAGKDYHYTLKAEIVKDGKPVVITKKITVHAGEETVVSIEPTLETAAAN